METFSKTTINNALMGVTKQTIYYHNGRTIKKKKINYILPKKKKKKKKLGIMVYLSSKTLVKTLSFFSSYLFIYLLLFFVVWPDQRLIYFNLMIGLRLCFILINLF